MAITLNPDLQARIDEKVRKGELASADALVEEALAMFLHEDLPMSEAEFREVETAIGESLAQAERGETVTLEDFDREMRARYGIPR